VFVSSHDIEEVQRLADRVAIINRGKLALDETSDSLQARFRAIEVVMPDEVKAPVNLPNDWLHAEQAGRTLRFTASRFANEDSLAAMLREAIPTATHHEVRPMSLREIFVALARAYRLEGK
jgi:ABC-2 type transport system ATP-binding protein